MTTEWQHSGVTRGCTSAGNGFSCCASASKYEEQDPILFQLSVCYFLRHKLISTIRFQSEITDIFGSCLVKFKSSSALNEKGN